MTSDAQFDSIRPYLGAEIPTAVERLKQAEEFLFLFSQLAKIDKSLIVDLLQGITTRDDFQSRFFGPIIQKVIEKTADGVSISGLNHLDKGVSYLFISNHRDIILDSATLNLLLRNEGFHYCEAAIGNNLLINEWVTDLVKLDACFVIERDLPIREMISSSSLRSNYIRSVIHENKNSIWIAQKEGRTKNGDDRTQQSLLKMFRMSGPKDFIENFRELRIVPVAISYEWEPCDDLKTDELYQRNTGEYVKTPAADMNSMYQGLAAYKGGIHFSICPPIGQQALQTMVPQGNNSERIAELAKFIDKQIHTHFKLWPNNYIAYDLLHCSNRFTSNYTEEEKNRFIQDMMQKITRLDGNRSILNNLFLEIYANPLKNRFAYTSE